MSKKEEKDEAEGEGERECKKGREKVRVILQMAIFLLRSSYQAEIMGHDAPFL